MANFTCLSYLGCFYLSYWGCFSLSYWGCFRLSYWECFCLCVCLKITAGSSFFNVGGPRDPRSIAGTTWRIFCSVSSYILGLVPLSQLFPFIICLYSFRYSIGSKNFLLNEIVDAEIIIFLCIDLSWFLVVKLIVKFKMDFQLYIYWA